MMRLRRPSRGFTIIELVVTITVLALLVALAAPNLASWVQNTRVRTAADYIQNGLRQAQIEAIKQNRVVAFVLTNALANSANMPAATTSGSYWYVATVPWTNATIAAASGTENFIVGGTTSTDSTATTITGPSALCFSPSGRPTTTFVDQTGVTTALFQCNAAAVGMAATPPMVTYVAAPATASATQHPLNVTVSGSGQIRMCDPAKSLTAGYPDGC